MDKGLFTGVMIDLHKAFDIVDHKLLLKKLQVYGLNTNSLKWFQSYLSRRYQKVCVNGKLSEPLSIHYGVLQGSIILAFMPMTLYASALTLAEVEEKIKSDIDGMQLTKVESERVLGVYIDSQLIWNEHIDTLRRKLLQGIAILARAWKYISTKYQLLLYNASIKPLFTYCWTVWSNCSQTNLDELFKIQKCCAQFILDSPRDARSYDNFKKLKWLPVDQLFKLNKFRLLKKVIYGKAPKYLIATLDSSLNASTLHYTAYPNAELKHKENILLFYYYRTKCS